MTYCYKYIFENAQSTELESVFELINDRIKWMDNNGIEQWNKTDYWGSYPKQYYQDAVKSGTIFLLKKQKGKRIVGAVVLITHDSRWSDDEPAIYIHNLVTAIDENGAGKAILKFCEKYAISQNRKVLRLDCAEGNVKLNKYYELAGYRYIGSITDGLYTGNKREKRIMISL